MPLAPIYWIIISIKNYLYDTGFFHSKKIPIPVISIGNISLGGTGKTPAVIFFAKKLIESGKKVGILSRGYGRKIKENKILINANQSSLVHEYGDEPILMSLELPTVPIAIGADRYISGKLLLEKYDLDILIMDDGFQHRKIHRDVDIVLINSLNKMDDYKLVPFGLLRESVSSLSRANFIIVTKSNLQRPSTELIKMIQQNTNSDVIESTYELDEISNGIDRKKLNNGKNIIAISAIGDPKSFEKTIINEGMNISFHFRFPDHYNYKQSDINNCLEALKNKKGSAIITTMKDYVKIKQLNTSKIDSLLFIARSKFSIDKNNYDKNFTNFLRLDWFL